MISYIEFLDRTKSAAVYIQLPSADSWVVHVHPQHVALSTTTQPLPSLFTIQNPTSAANMKSSTLLASLPPTMRLDVGRCDSLAKIGQDDIVSFRVPFHGHEASAEPTKPSTGDQSLFTAESANDHLRCSRCGTGFLSNAKVSHIYPLPSLYWAETLDSWMCHGDGLPTQAMEQSKTGLLLPPVGSLLGSEVYVIILASHAINLTADDANCDDGPVRCARCLHFVGRTILAPGTVDCGGEGELRADSRLVAFRLLRYRLYQGPSLAGYICQYLINLIQADLTGKLMVVANESHHSEHALLLWAWAGESTVVDSSNSNEFQRGMKVRYLDRASCLDHQNFDEIFHAWHVDAAVRSLTLDVSSCKELSRILHESSIKLPPMLRAFQKMRFGFLSL